MATKAELQAQVAELKAENERLKVSATDPRPEREAEYVRLHLEAGLRGDESEAQRIASGMSVDQLNNENARLTDILAKRKERS